MQSRLTVLPGQPRGIQWYADPGWGDHRVLQQFIADHESDMLSGVLVSAGDEIRKFQQSLREEARAHDLEVILDPHVLESAHEGGAERGTVKRQPWSLGRVVRPIDLRGRHGATLARQMAEEAIALGCTAVVTPSHFLAKGDHDPWWLVDCMLALRLRHELARLNRSDILVYYRLALPAALLREDAGVAARIVRRLRRLRVDALWLLFHPAGLSHGGPESIRGHLQACQVFQRLGVPLIFERAGLVGLAIAAYGGVGGISSGVGAMESFDVTSLLHVDKPKEGESFGPPQRVYLPELFAYLKRDEARAFFENRLMRARYGCQRRCCRGAGPEDTIRQPKLHALFSKADELRRVSETPEHRRPDTFRGEVHQSVTGLVQASQVAQPLETTMRRLAALDRSLEAASRLHLALRYDLPLSGVRPATGATPRPQVVS